FRRVLFRSALCVGFAVKVVTCFPFELRIAHHVRLEAIPLSAVLACREPLKVLSDVQPAYGLATKRDDVVNVAACRAALVEEFDRVAICPRWRLLQLERPPTRDLRAQLRSVVLHPLLLIQLVPDAV